MTKDELMVYAEQGVRDELNRMQAKINELARVFPHIVCHQDGTIPSVAPVAPKTNGKPYPTATSRPAGTPRVPRAERIEQARAFLSKHPDGVNGRELGEAIGLGYAHAQKLIAAVGRPLSKYKPGSRVAIRYVLKGK